MQIRATNPGFVDFDQDVIDAESINENLGRRVKKLRGDRRLSLEELASASGVSRSMLSEIERKRANPTLSVTYRIARAFGLSLQDLIESADSASTIQLIRASDRGQIFRTDKQCQIRTLSPLNLEKEVEFYELRLPAGGALLSQPHVEGTREFLTVEFGKTGSSVVSCGHLPVIILLRFAMYLRCIDERVSNIDA